MSHDLVSIDLGTIVFQHESRLRSRGLNEEADMLVTRARGARKNTATFAAFQSCMLLVAILQGRIPGIRNGSAIVRDPDAHADFVYGTDLRLKDGRTIPFLENKYQLTGRTTVQFWIEGEKLLIDYRE